MSCSLGSVSASLGVNRGKFYPQDQHQILSFSVHIPVITELGLSINAPSPSEDQTLVSYSLFYVLQHLRDSEGGKRVMNLELLQVPLEGVKLAGLSRHAGDRRVRLTFQLQRRLRAVGRRHVGGRLRRRSCVEALFHPPVSVHPLLPVSRRGLVRAHVLGQVVVAHEHSGTQRAAELLGAGVRL